MRQIVALLVLLAACSCSSEVGTVDCPAGTIPVGALCRPTCTTDAQCLASEMCVDGACVPEIVGADSGVQPPPPPACTRDQECGPSFEGEWTDCGGFDDTCDETGRQRREVTIPRCRNAKCELEQNMEGRDCRVTKLGVECGQRMVGPFGECRFRDECTTSGEHSHDITTFACSNEVCEMKTSPETEPCARPDRTGTSCAPYRDTGTDPCMPDANEPCSGFGLQNTYEREWTCKNDACEPEVIGGQSMHCVLNPPPADGTSCGMAQQCCGGVCVTQDDPNNCGVCYNACSENRGCLTLPRPGMGPRYSCSCEDPVQCWGSGPNASCEFGPTGIGFCSCSCAGQPSPCAGQCVTGSCYELTATGYCSYP